MVRPVGRWFPVTKGEPETEEPLPSLPSSKTSSRVPSIEDLKSLRDDDGLKSWEHVDLSHSITGNQEGEWNSYLGLSFLDSASWKCSAVGVACCEPRRSTVNRGSEIPP
jgi:hypothetical protein